MSRFRAWRIDDEVDVRMGTEGLAAYPPETIMQRFQRTAAQLGAANVMHVKRDGVWQSITVQQHYDRCAQFAKALLHVGAERFAGVSIIGFNAPEWATALLGAIMAGCVGAGIYSTNHSHACEYIAKHSSSVVAVCDGVKQLEKFLAIQQNLPKLKALVVYNAPVPEGLQSKVPVYAFEEFLQLGADVAESALQERIDAQRPGHCCTLIYTSGTTGDPKAVMISNDNVTWIIDSILNMLNRQFRITAGNQDRLVSFLPLSHIAAQMVDVMLPAALGIQVYFAQPDALKGTLGVTLREVRPTLFFGVPRVWEKIAEKMASVAAQTTGIKKQIAAWAKSKGAQKTAMAQYGQSGGEPCGFRIAHALVLGRVKEALGMDQCIAAFSAAAPTAPEIVEYFGSLDLPLYDFYGQSETSGPSSCTMRGIWKMGSSGPSIDGSVTKIVPETQEIIFQGRSVMMGYLHSEEQTKETIDDEGWLHTGDCGTIDEDGFVTITGRIKELIITAGGENIPPVLIEQEIKQELPIVSNAMLIGDKRKFLSCLLTLRVKVDSDGLPTDQLDEIARHICKQIGSSATTVAEAIACSKVQQHLSDGIKRANAKAASLAQQVRKFEVIATDFSIGTGELTPTLKLKRRVVLEKYDAVIEKMYAV